MVEYKLSLSELTDNEKEAILNALKECKSFNVNQHVLIFLMQEMNRMYGKNVYTLDNLSCRDCLNNITYFWKMASKEWIV